MPNSSITCIISCIRKWELNMMFPARRWLWWARRQGGTRDTLCRHVQNKSAATLHMCVYIYIYIGTRNTPFSILPRKYNITYIDQFINFQKSKKIKMGLFVRKSVASRVKTTGNVAISRISILRKQHHARCSYARSDVVQLLRLGHHNRALLRVAFVIKEQDMCDALAMIENYCHLLIDRRTALCDTVCRSSRFGDPFADAGVDPKDLTLFKLCSKSGDLAVAARPA